MHSASAPELAHRSASRVLSSTNAVVEPVRAVEPGIPLAQLIEKRSRAEELTRASATNVISVKACDLLSKTRSIQSKT